ncbi:TniB family NTP-binding protein [Pseudomonadota bacterium]
MTAAAKRKHLFQNSLFEEIDEDRLDQIWSEFWANYPEGIRALKHLARLFKQPRSHRPQSSLIIAGPATGKSAIARQFEKTVNPNNDPGKEERVMPVVYVQAPPDGKVAALYSDILEAINEPYKPTWQPLRKQHLVLFMLTKLKTRMLIVDELHHFLAGNVRDRSVFMNVLKHLSSELQICIVGVGTKEVLRAMHVDEQFASRFEPYQIQRWEPDEEYMRFLIQVCRHAKFKGTAQLKRKAFVRRIHALSKGLTGETWKLICKLIEYAEINGYDQLEIEMLDQIDWTMPGERRWIASRNTRQEKAYGTDTRRDIGKPAGEASKNDRSTKRKPQARPEQ